MNSIELALAVEDGVAYTIPINSLSDKDHETRITSIDH